MQQSTGNKGDCPAAQGEGGAVLPPPEILAAGTEPEDSSPYAGRLSFVSLGAVLKDLSHVHVAGINNNGESSLQNDVPVLSNVPAGGQLVHDILLPY